jgi:hypothetical protein
MVVYRLLGTYNSDVRDRVRVMSRPNIFVDQGQFSYPDFFTTHIKGKMSNLPIKEKVGFYCQQP